MSVLSQILDEFHSFSNRIPYAFSRNLGESLDLPKDLTNNQVSATYIVQDYLKYGVGTMPNPSFAKTIQLSKSFFARCCRQTQEMYVHNEPSNFHAI